MTPPRPGAAGTERLLGEFAVASAPGNERSAFAKVSEVVAGVGLAPEELKRLETAVAEATMNAIEHGNRNDPEQDVEIRVFAVSSGVAVTVSDNGGARPQPAAAVPDLDAKLAGLQSPRGWGLFIIQNMVDALEVSTVAGKHVVRLEIHAGAHDGEARPSTRGGASS